MLYIAGRPVRIKKNTLHGCHKKEHGSEIAQSQQPENNDIFGVTVKVAEPGYVPPGLKLRGHISDDLFTANVTSQDIENLETDSRVLSISAPRKLHGANNDSVA
ncbi:hypothetical protein IQ247_14185 [Plectonema cf. radiosum LEGE 06105]|uniref:Uncharacterized protein n=1 Tax=Plectonema cf. radiosum LEGE 06105 TaxID=945769 RepID=A0A8J7F0P0_9CYAN|nr:hypothetical protein [Plectonema radiosum]MBE9213801.1 hypothetical protein [Plectonema cf. radiosum LEGE 06105]